MVEAVVGGELGRDGREYSGPHDRSPSDISVIYEMARRVVKRIPKLIYQ